LAALRPDGLSATLSELSRQLTHWVALFDATGGLDRGFPPDAFARAVYAAKREGLTLYMMLAAAVAIVVDVVATLREAREHIATLHYKQQSDREHHRECLVAAGFSA